MISEYKGQCMVSIREYYEKDGQALPGKKVRPSLLERCVSKRLSKDALRRYLHV